MRLFSTNFQSFRIVSCFSLIIVLALLAYNIFIWYVYYLDDFTAPIVQTGNNRGIVMCTSEKMLKFTFDSILQIRTDWNTSLSVVVAHCNELSSHSKQKLRSKGIGVIDICKGSISYTLQKKLRSFYCKAAALYMSPFEDTMLIDVDLIWFNKPDLLFDSPGYQSTGALFFRDRLVYQLKKGQKRDGLFQKEVEDLIAQESRLYVTRTSNSNGGPSDAIGVLSQERYGVRNKSNFSFFWRNTKNRASPAIQHVQESSVVLLRKSNHLGTLHVIHKLLPKYQQGYGDKEIYWIAATIAKEDYAWEPFLFSVYGDCGAIMHYDPREITTTSTAAYYSLSASNIAVTSGGNEKEPIDSDLRLQQLQPKIFFMNAEYLLEKFKYIGDGLQSMMAKPVLVTDTFQLFDMDGGRNKKTGGRCGACKNIGCIPVPTYINQSVIDAQRRRQKLMRLSRL